MTAVLSLLRQCSSGKHKRSERRRRRCGRQLRLVQCFLHSWLPARNEVGELCIHRSSSRLTITSSHAWLITHSPLHLFQKFLPIVFSSAFQKWYLMAETPTQRWPPIRSDCCLMTGELSSRPSIARTLWHSRTKLACLSKLAKSIKCNRWFWDELTLQLLTLLKNYLGCTFDVMGGWCSSMTCWWRWISDRLAARGSLLSLADWI